MLTVALETLTVLPNVQFRKNRFFYIYYDLAHATLCLTLIAVMLSVGHRGVIETWRPEYWLLLPVVTYFQILASVFIHVCTHKSLPRSINRLVGEICGLIVITRFASWEIIHQRHHQYSDDVERDPHPIVPSYWRFLVKTIVNVEAQLQRIYFETYGDSPENHRFEKRRAYLSYATNLLLIATWYVFLGPQAFFFLMLPASILGFFHLVHFNWSTHNAAAGKDFHPVNLDRGYYWLGNRIWFGIYMHANHHDRPSILNPMKMPARRNT